MKEPIDPIVAALFERLPVPGSVWPEAERMRWLDAVRASFDLIYKDEAALKMGLIAKEGGP